MVDKDLNELLLYVNASATFCKECGAWLSEEGKTSAEIIAGLNWTKKRAKTTISKAENSGMLRGVFEHHPKDEWVRHFFIGGESTRDYLKIVKKYQSSVTKVEME